MLTGGYTAAYAAEDILTIETRFGTESFQIEFANTPEQRSQGLMFRQSLAADRGMLFDFGDPHEVAMWMKNTYISLDMIFIRADGIIHRIQRDTEPHSLTTISSNGNVAAVLEVSAGVTERLNIQPGDMIRHEMFSQ